MDPGLCVAAELIRSTQDLSRLLKEGKDIASAQQHSFLCKKEERCAAALLRAKLVRELNVTISDLLALKEFVDKAVMATMPGAPETKPEPFCNKLSNMLQSWTPNNKDLCVFRNRALEELSNISTNGIQFSGQIASFIDNDENEEIFHQLNKRQSEVVPETEKLEKLIQDLRRMDADLGFQSQTLHETKKLSESLRHDTSNFAYGSTPLASWVEVLDNPVVYPHICHHKDNGKILMVWGSSTGRLPFYSGLVYGLRSVGVEIMKTRVDIARKMAEKYSIDSVEFIHGNILKSDLSNVGILVLTSQCWDDDLKIKAYGKLFRDLAPGALCIDYTAGLTRAFGDPLVVVETKVSWNDQQKIFVFTKPEKPLD